MNFWDRSGVFMTTCFCLAINLAGCSFDLAVVPALTADQVLRKVSVTSGREMTLEEGQEYDVTVLIQTPNIPNLYYKPVTLSWSIVDPDGDFEESSGDIEVSSFNTSSVTFKLKPKKDALIEQDEVFTLVFSGGSFEDLSENTISLTVLDRTTPAKVEATLADIDFGAHLINDSADRTLTLRNSGDATAENLSLPALSSPFSYKGGSFPGLGGNCTSTLSGGSSCTTVLTYSSAVAASNSANLVWNYTTPADPDNGSVTLKGLSVEVNAVLGGLPSTQSNASALNVSVSGVDITNYRYKIGPASSTNCSVASGYSSDLSVASSITNSLTSWPNQNIRLCVIGQESHGVWQLYSQATSHDWFFDNTVPTATLEQKIGQADPARTTPVEFTVTFSEAITGLTTSDFIQSGTANVTAWNLITTDNITWTLQATTIAGDGTIIPSLPAGAVTDLAGNTNTAATSADASVLYDSTVPTLIINQRAGQADPTNTLPIYFTVIFSEPINSSSFTAADITQNGTATGVVWNLTTTDSKTWTLSAIAAGEGTLAPSVAAGTVQDPSGNLNTASSSTDNSVTYSTSAPNNASSLAWQQSSPTNTTSLMAEWTKSASTLASQSIQFYTGSTCNTPFGSAQSPGPSGQTYALTGTTGMTYTYKITSEDLATNSIESSCSAPITVDTTAPTILNVTSTKANGAYKAGSVIDIQITFSESVSVTGVPVLNLNTTPARTASYASGSGTSVLTFNYTVQAGDTAADLNYATTTALTIAGASIYDEATNNAVLTLPGLAAAGSLGTNKNLEIDTTAPTISVFSISNASPTNTTTYTLTSSVTGSPTDYCILENVTTISSCSWIAGSSLPVSFTVSATNNSKTLYAWVRDAAGNVSAMSTSNAVSLDTVAPTINLTGFPTGTSAKYSLTITPSGTDIVTYQYKLGPTASTVCSSSSGYSSETLISTVITANISALANGSITLCAIGKDTAGNWQAYASATEKTWTKNTPTLQFTLTTSSVSEYDSPSHTVQVSIPTAVDVNVSASYAFSAGAVFPATAGVDYTATPGTVTILAGSTTANIVIPIIDDLRYENNETFNVNLSTPTGTYLGSQVQHVVTIIDDDDPPLISIQDVVVTEGASTSLRASLSATSDKGAITLNWAVDTCTGSDCATSPTHYTMSATSGTATIPQGSAYVDFGSVSTVDNAADEPHRRIPIKITSVTGGTLLSGKANVIINDNDYPLGKNAVQIAANYDTACALTGNQKVYCWGKNTRGQLGQGDIETRDGIVEVVIGASLPVAKIVGTADRFCALTTGQQVYCWGYAGNASSTGGGFIGTGSTSSAYTPVYISALGTGVTDISISYYNTCALKGSALYCWGSNYYGIVGGTRTDPPTSQRSAILMPAPLDQNVSKVSMGVTHACVLIANEVYCWGDNTAGQLGRGVTYTATNPGTTAEKVIGLSGTIVDVWAGYYTTCAKNSAGEVYCWGRNTERQYSSNPSNVYSTPQRVPEFDNADYIVPQRTLCLIRNQELLCRGDNLYGSVGHNIAGGEKVLELVNPLGGETGITNVDVGAANTYTCFVRSGQAYCTGFAGSSSLGDGYQGSFSTPQLATGISGLGAAPSSITQGTSNTCGLFNGAVKCWGWNSSFRSGNQSPEMIYMDPTPVKGLTAGYTSLAIAGSGACALHSSGELKCWGHGAARGNGLYSTTNGNPVTPTGMSSGVTGIYGGNTVTTFCAIKDGEAYCWGSNEYGSIGTGNLVEQSVPFKIPGGSDVVEIALTGYSVCLLKSTGKLWCAGTNNYGTLGMGDTTARYTFTEIPTLSNVVKIASITGGMCARTADNKLYCWGRILPDGNSANRTSPTLMTALPNTTDIVGGPSDHYCAKTDGTWKCWGLNTNGQFGDGTMSATVNYNAVTTAFYNVGTFSQLSIGTNKTCAKYGNDYYCAGLEAYSEFARNNKPYRIAPISVMPFP